MRWSMLPVSVAAHAVALVALLIVPLAAVGELPAPRPLARWLPFVTAKALPSLPVQPPRAARHAAPSTAAPTQAPEGIRPEVAVHPSGPIVDGALPPEGFGVATGAPAGLVDLGPVPEPPPPPPPKAPDPVRPGGHIKAPEKIAHVAPKYPEVARAARVEGLVILEAIIDERGAVTRIRVLRSVPLLDTAAIEAFRQWRYTPTLLNGIPVPVIMTITCRFSLDGGGDAE